MADDSDDEQPVNLEKYKLIFTFLDLSFFFLTMYSKFTIN
jgi:hypothetical protein